MRAAWAGGAVSPPFGVLACRFVLALALALFSTAPLVASAASPLLSVRAHVENGTPHITLVFTSTLPQYRVFSNGSTEVTILLLGAIRASNIQVLNGAKPAIKDIAVEDAGENVQIVIHSKSPLTASVAPDGGLSLAVALTNALPQASPTPPPFGLTRGDSDRAVTTSNAAGDTTVVVPLKYADVSEIVGLLTSNAQITSNDSFSPQPSSLSQQGFGVYGGAGQLSMPLQNNAQNLSPIGGGGALGQQITENIGIDRRLNAIVLTGSPAQIAKWRAKIAQLDVPLNGVLFETQIVELTDSAAHDVGIDFTNGGGPIGTVQVTSVNAASSQTNYTLQAAVYAQIAHGKGKIIARPRIVASNGTPASILTGDALPIVTAITVSGVNAVQQQVQYVNIGVNLQILPRISSSGYVTSHIFSEVSSVTGYQQGYPIISQRQASTLATVKDGEPFVIGGLLQQSELSNVSKIPGLGDLPIIGGLFRLRRDSSELTNLYIIVTPHIVHAGEEPAP